MNLMKYILLAIISLTALNAKELKVVGPWEITGLEPNQSGGIFSRTQIAETLVAVDEDGKLIPNLAKSWNVSKDGLVWTFELRKNITFHDNTPLDADIVAFNFNRETLLEKSVLRYLPITKIRPRKNTIEITLSSTFGALASYFAHSSTIILSKGSFNDKNRVDKIIGTGAYKITNITAPLKLKAIRFDGWWRGKAHIKNISYLAVGKGETRSLMMRSKEAHIAYSLPPSSLNVLKKDKTLNTTLTTIPRTTLLKVNVGSEFFSDQKVRQALSLSLDRFGMSKAILGNENLLATQIFPPFMKLWHNEKMDPLHYDIKMAKRLLEKAGWKLRDDGYRYKNNKKFTISIDTYPNRPELPLIATAIQDQLKSVGIELEVLIGNYSEVVRKHQDNTLHLALISRNFSLVPNPLGFLLQDYSKGGGDWGAMNWDNEDMFKYLEKLKAKDNEKLHYKIAQILQDDLPSIPIAWTELSVVSSKQVKNVKVDPFELSYFLSDIIWAK